MGRVSFRDDFYEDKHAEQAGIPALGLFVCSVAFTHRHGLDGFIPFNRLRELGSVPQTLELASHEALADSLITSSLFEVSAHGYVIRNYDRYQRTAAQRQLGRQRDAERKRRVRAGPNRTSSDPPISTLPPEGLGSDVCDLRQSQFSSALTGDFQETREALERLAARVGVGEDSVVVWLQYAKDLPESAIASAEDWLKYLRGKEHVGNPGAVITRHLRRLSEERAA